MADTLPEHETLLVLQKAPTFSLELEVMILQHAAEVAEHWDIHERRVSGR